MQTHFLPSQEDVFFVNPFRKTDNPSNAEHSFFLSESPATRSFARLSSDRSTKPTQGAFKSCYASLQQNTTGTGTPVSSSVDGRTTSRNIQIDDPDLKTSQKNGCGNRSSSRYSALRPDPNIESRSIIRARPNNSVR
jgi:hypothetical protein